MSGEFDSEYLPYGAQGINGDPAFDDDDDVEAQSFNTFYSSRLSPGLVGGHASTISSFPTSHAASELGEVAGGEGGGADLGAAIGRITFADEEDNDDVALRPLAGADIAEEEASIRSPLRRRVLRIVENIYVRIFSLVLVILDIILLFVRIGKSGWKFRDDDDEPAAYNYVSIAIIAYFLLELLLRIYAHGPVKFFTNPWDVLDAVVIIAATILTFVFEAGRVVILVRVVRILLILKLIHERRNIPKSIRLKISENKRRYRENGFDLDLTYITDRIIAMSFPSQGRTSLYRNPIAEVVRFFSTQHKDHYLIFNLCAEAEYDPAYFDNRVERLHVLDHTPPNLSDLLQVCVRIREFLGADPENVVAVHCKGGKGRTGSVISAWLLFSRKCPDAETALAYFGSRRTDLSISSKFQGVQTPSQARYVHYIEDIVHAAGPNGIATIPVCRRSISTIRVTDMSLQDIWFQIFVNGKEIFNFRRAQAQGQATLEVLSAVAEDGSTIMLLEYDIGGVLVKDDVMIKFHSENLPSAYENCPFYFLFHSSFVRDNRLYIPREELDNPHKRKTWKIYRQHFGVEIFFSDDVAGDAGLVDSNNAESWA